MGKRSSVRLKDVPKADGVPRSANSTYEPDPYEVQASVSIITSTKRLNQGFIDARRTRVHSQYQQQFTIETNLG